MDDVVDMYAEYTLNIGVTFLPLNNEEDCNEDCCPYFGLTTLTTVGFGDITPITFQGRLVVMGSILVGIAVIPGNTYYYILLHTSVFTFLLLFLCFFTNIMCSILHYLFTTYY